MNDIKKIVEIANEVLENKISVVVAARKLEKYQFGFGLESNKSILFFVALASETENLPIGEERKNWDADALLEKDIEIKNIEDSYREDALSAARHLIKDFSE